MIRLSDALCNAVLDAGIATQFDGDFLDFYTTSQPASANNATSGTLVASIALPADALGAAANRQLAKAGVWEDAAADAAGIVGWARFRELGDTGASDATKKRMDVRCGTAAAIAWASATAYLVGDKRLSGGFTYICTEAHTSDADTEPGIGPAWLDMWDPIEMTLDNDNVAAGQGFTVTGFTLTQPNG